MKLLRSCATTDGMRQALSMVIRRFLYTVGLMESLHHPEFIIFGLDAENAYALFSGLIAEIRDGVSYTDNGVRTVDLGGSKHRVAFRRVHPTQHPLYLGLAMAFWLMSAEWGNCKPCRRIGRTRMGNSRWMLVVI